MLFLPSASSFTTSSVYSNIPSSTAVSSAAGPQVRPKRASGPVASVQNQNPCRTCWVLVPCGTRTRLPIRKCYFQLAYLSQSK